MCCLCVQPNRSVLKRRTTLCTSTVWMAGESRRCWYCCCAGCKAGCLWPASLNIGGTATIFHCVLIVTCYDYTCFLCDFVCYLCVFCVLRAHYLHINMQVSSYVSVPGTDTGSGEDIQGIGGVCSTGVGGCTARELTKVSKSPACNQSSIPCGVCFGVCVSFSGEINALVDRIHLPYMIH